MAKLDMNFSRRVFGRVALIGSTALSGVVAPKNNAAANVTTSRRMNRGYAEGPYGLIHYRQLGEGFPLIMLHQAPMSSRQFENVYGLLADKGLRVIGIDTPGFGMSDPTDFVPTIEDWAKAIPPVMDHLGIEIADVLGHHTGCLLATEFAIQYPGKVRNLVMAGPHPIDEDERKKSLEGVEKREVNFVYEHDGSHLMNSFGVRYRMYGEGADPKTITRYAVEKFMGTGPFWYGHHAAFQYDQGAKIPRIKHRTLIITNTGDVIYESAQKTRKMRPDFEYVELEGGGVDIVDQQPVAWVNAVVEFLEGK